MLRDLSMLRDLWGKRFTKKVSFEFRVYWQVYWLVSCFCGVQAAMRDRWLNTGYHGEELRPYVEQTQEVDPERVGKQHYDFSFNAKVFVLFA